MNDQRLKEKYLVIARKYRPQTFASMVGQEAIVSTLKNALRHNRLAHAYLFAGSRGTGKTTLARLFAKALNCRALTQDQEPCNSCPSCLEIAQGRSLDVLEIDGASNRGIDDIREINETVGYSAASGKYKIYIIDEVHMLTKEAFNALLKTLEEPPANVKFFFATTEPHKVLPTIISRCQRFDLNRIADVAMRKKLAYIASDLGIQVDEGALFLLTKKAEGSLRDAESLLDQIFCYADKKITLEMVTTHLGMLPKEAFFALDKAIHARDLSFAFSLAEQLFSSGKDLTCFLDDLMEHFRLLMRGHLGQTLDGISPKEEESYRASLKLYTLEECTYILDYLMVETSHFTRSSFKRITLEMILLHLVRSRMRVPTETLVQRLFELEKALGSGPVAPVAAAVPVVPEAAVAALVPEVKLEVEATIAPVVITPPTPSPLLPASPPAAKEEDKKKKMRQETLLRFAAVELEGALKK